MKTIDIYDLNFDNRPETAKPSPPSQSVTLTLDSESLDCLRQCMKADRSVLEEEFGWPDWMLEEVIERLEKSNR